MLHTNKPLNILNLQIPWDIESPALREAGLAWLDFAVALFAQEPFSYLTLSWARDFEGKNPALRISLDSSKNFKTRGLRERVGAPEDVTNRRLMFDKEVEVLFSKTTPDELWSAVIASQFSSISAWDFSHDVHEESYPRFASGRDFLVHVLPLHNASWHPWL
ncbi:ABC transporter ATP-binding protein [Novimethylophilus kurashikiensis]|uniref:ABC transporter ATP-binding protein n=1 Tax=Novimethylophilus kurashikiensis TaxID=1825523 RepID=A0A2R5F7X5_9PROT|nr:hypothetical protein [Novimethylophilus kurashikiensis]GBG14342.1 ABC transporter ATP-binding protein [Novimethylophilus kurashikiensis]